MRAMVVDDDPLVSDLVALCLSRDGFEVSAPPTAAVALDEIALAPPDVLLLDIRMPGLDGLEVLRTLRACDISPATRVLMLTGEDDLHFVRAARELGASGYLVKPFVAERLTATVRKLVDHAEVSWIDDHHAVTRGEAPTGAKLLAV